jgi:RNA polymerase sigma factor (sigma-70 family)
MRDDDEAGLIRQVADGSENAFSQLLDRHQGIVRTFLRRIGPSPHEADDLAQETFLAAWQGAKSFAGRSSVRTWLLGIAWRKASNARRGWFRSAVRDGAWTSEQSRHAPIDAGREEAIAVRNALGALPLEQKACLALCLGGEFSHSEAAEALGLPLGTVKSHVARGRTRLRDMLGDRR